MGSSTPLSKMKVLVGEDSEESLLLIQSYLKSLGLEWQSAKDGHELLRYAFQEKFDLFLIDIGLPILSGLDAVREMRKKGLSAPIISISANSAPQDLETYRTAGFTESLAKPFNRKQFISKVSALLGIEIPGTASGVGADSSWGPLAAQFAETLPLKVNELYDVLESKDYERLGFLAHRIRAAGMFGFNAVSEACSEIDAALKAGEPARLKALLEKLSSAVADIKRAQ